jgi:ribosomal subunit interface protein
MVVNVACRDSALAFGARRAVADCSERLERYFNNILSVHWDLTMEGPEHVVDCRLHCGAGSYRASAHAIDFPHALHAVLDKLVRQRRRDKQKSETARHDLGVGPDGPHERGEPLTRGH